MELLEGLEIEPGDLGQIAGVAQDVGGSIYLADEFNHRIIKLNQDGRCSRVWGQIGTGIGDLHYPYGLAMIGERLFVADSWNQRIQIFGTNGEPLGQIKNDGSPIQIKIPLDVAPGPDGLLWVVDMDQSRVLCFDLETLKLQKVLVGASDTLECTGIAVRRLCFDLYLPRQLRFLGDVGFLIHQKGLLRLGPQANDELQLSLPEPQLQLLTVSHFQALTYAPCSGKVRSHCFIDMEINELMQVPALPGQVLCVGTKLWQLEQNRVKVTELSKIDLAGQNLCPKSHEDPFGQREAQLETLAGSIFGLEGEIKRYLDDWIESSPMFLGEGQIPVSQAHLPDFNSIKSVLTQVGADLVLPTRTALTAWQECNLQVLARLKLLLLNQHPPVSHTWAAIGVARCADFFCELLKYRASLCACLADIMAEAHCDPARVRHLDGCLYILECYLKFGFDLLLVLRGLLTWAGFQRLADRDLDFFFILASKSEFNYFQPHLLNCLLRLFPQRLESARSATAALKHCWPALIGLAKADVAQTAGGVSRAETDALLLGYKLLVCHRQGFLFKGRYHRAYAYPYRLQEILIFVSRLGSSVTSELLHFLREGDSWTLFMVRLEVIHYLLRQPDQTEGRLLLAQEQANCGPSDPRHKLLSSYRTVIEDDPQRALALLTTLEGQSDFMHIRMQVHVNFCQFDQALELISSVDSRHWRTAVLLLQLYLCTGRYTAAGALFEQHIEGLTPDHMILLKAIVQCRLRQYDQALALFDQVEQPYPQTYDYHLGLLMRSMGEDQKALASFERQAVRCPFLANSVEKAITLRKLGHDELYRAALTALPDMAYLNQGMRRIGVRAPEFSQVVDDYIDWERHPLPELGNDLAAQTRCLGMLRSQIFESVFYLFQDNQELQVQSYCPFEIGV